MAGAFWSRLIPSRAVLRLAHFGFFVAVIAGCAEATRTGSNDLSRVEMSAVEDGGDMAVELPDLQVVCDAGAGFRNCNGKCIGPGQCCDDSECPTTSNGGPKCNTLNKCDVTCNLGFKACNAACIPSTDCCSDADCKDAASCQVNQGAKCQSGVCNYPATQCPYTGQFCDSTTNSCVCPANQHPCVTVGAGGPMGQCIPTGTCCTNSDCASIAGQVCAGLGQACKCTAGFKTCTASSSCILDTTCCTSADCAVMGQSCSGPGGSCTCPAMQKACGAACIPITACCIDADCGGVTGAICQMGSCVCPSGKRQCNPTTGSPQCISNSPSVCCIDSDCSVSGAKCSGIGGSCSCPNNTYECAGNNTCIASSTCCSNSDCLRLRNISGESCSGPGGSCSCPAATKECPSGSGTPGTCVSTASGRCCTAADCSANHVSAANCSNTFCSVAANGCVSGFVDVNGSWSDGCECTDDGFGKFCNAATGLGNVGNFGSVSKTGVLPLAGEENWFQVTFVAPLNNSYHPHITISTSAVGDDIRFDLFNGGCGAGTLSCPSEFGSAATNRTNWEVRSTNGDEGAIGCGAGCGRDQCVCHSCNCTSAYNGMPQVGSGGTVFIRVHRASGSPTCNTYTLSVTD
jgi:hypothetical protein